MNNSKYGMKRERVKFWQTVARKLVLTHGNTGNFRRALYTAAHDAAIDARIIAYTAIKCAEVDGPWAVQNILRKE